MSESDSSIDEISNFIPLFFVSAPFLLILSTVFIIDHRLAHGIVSGKYFWFYGSMVLAAMAGFVYTLIRKPAFRFSQTDAFVLLFTGSVFLTSFVINDASANTTKLTLFALLTVLYFSFRIFIRHDNTATQNRVIF